MCPINAFYELELDKSSEATWNFLDSDAVVGRLNAELQARFWQINKAQITWSESGYLLCMIHCTMRVQFGFFSVLYLND